jgi:hypothetical protein
MFQTTNQITVFPRMSPALIKLLFIKATEQTWVMGNQHPLDFAAGPIPGDSSPNSVIGVIQV